MHWGHRVVSVLAIVSLWFHILWEKPDDNKRNIVRLSVITGGFVSNWIARLIVVVSNSWKYQHRCSVVVLHGAVRIKIPLVLGSSFELSPGQYIYIMIPTISLEMHRFYICWVDPQNIWLLVQPHAPESFTGQLARITHQTPVFVEGAYGPMTSNLGSYGTVMFIASGIRIAPILGCMKWLRKQHIQRKVVTQRISLIWEIEHDTHLDWVRDWVNQLLFEDVTRVGEAYSMQGLKC